MQTTKHDAGGAGGVPGTQAHIAALNAQIQQFRLLFNNVPAAIAYYEREGFICRYANARYAHMFGLTETSILGRTVQAIIGEEGAQAAMPGIEQVIRDRSTTRYERQALAPDGTPRHIEVLLVPFLDDAGQAIGAFVLLNDISEHRRAQAAARESEDRLAKFMQASAEGIVFHHGGVITDVNPPLLEMLGYRIEELLGREALDFVAPDQRARVAEVMASGAETGYDTAVVHRDGTVIPVQFIVRTMVHHGEQLRMTLVRDLRDRFEAQARIRHLAMHDALTGLPNRTAFDERGQTLLAQAHDLGQSAALLFIDLDQFKRVNDSLGHPAGDALLRTVSQRITDTLRSADLVARFGGDEFVLLLAGNPTPDAVSDVAAKLVAAVGAPLILEGVTISVTPSIGVALFPEHGPSIEALVKHADTAMYHAKHHGRAHWCFFEPAMAEAVYAELALEDRLAQAVREREFVLHFQPQLSLADGRLLGVQAQVRWAHPQRGLLGPEHFMALAEARRLVLPIGQWMLREALAHAARWHARRLARVPVAVAVTLPQFQMPGFADAVVAALEDTGASGECLELELTERTLVEDLAATRATLQRLRANGVRFTVADFGTGHTALPRLRQLPLQGLKLTRAFIAELPGDAGTAAMAHALIQLGRSLNLQVVAEGVERAEQRDWVRAQGAHAHQGPLAAEPMGAAEFEAWLTARR